MLFDEVQEYVNKSIGYWCVDHQTSLTGLAEHVLGVDKARLSELKSTEPDGSFSFPLSEKLLSTLIWRDIVDFEEIATKINPKDGRKQQWIKHQRYIKLIQRIEEKQGDFPIEETLQKIFQALS